MLSAIGLRTSRQTLGLSAQRFGVACGYANGRIVRRWEAGEVPVPGSVERLVAIWTDPRCPDWAKPWMDN